MGGSSSKKAAPKASSSKAKAADDETQDDETIKVLQVCLSSLLLPLNRSVSDDIVSSLLAKAQRQTVDTNTKIIEEGAIPEGLYIILSGHAEVSIQGLVIGILGPGCYCGEVSILFGKATTAQVTAKERMDILLLPASEVLSILEQPLESNELIDWFVHHRYLATSVTLDKDRLLRRMILTIAKSLPILNAWSEASLKKVILSLMPSMMVIYPANSYIVQKGDPPTVLTVLVRGRATLSDRDEVLEPVHVEHDAFCFGEEGVFLGEICKLNVMADTPCFVIKISQEVLLTVLSEFSAKETQDAWDTRAHLWKERYRRTSDIEKQLNSPALLTAEVVCILLKKTAMFSHCSYIAAYEVATRSVLCHIEPETSVSSHISNIDAGSLLLMVSGALKMNSESPATSSNTATAFHKGDLISGSSLDSVDYITESSTVIVHIRRNIILELIPQYAELTVILSDNTHPAS